MGNLLTPSSTPIIVSTLFIGATASLLVLLLVPPPRDAMGSDHPETTQDGAQQQQDGAQQQQAALPSPRYAYRTPVGPHDACVGRGRYAAATCRVAALSHTHTFSP